MRRKNVITREVMKEGARRGMLLCNVKLFREFRTCLRVFVVLKFVLLLM